MNENLQQKYSFEGSTGREITCPKDQLSGDQLSEDQLFFKLYSMIYIVGDSPTEI